MGLDKRYSGDFTDFLGVALGGTKKWGFDQSDTIDRTFTNSDLSLTTDEMMDLKLLGEYIQSKADEWEINLMDYNLVKASVAVSDDKELTPELLGQIAYGVYLSQHLEIDGRNNDGSFKMNAQGSMIINFTGDENEVAGEKVVKALIEDNDRNPDNNNNPQQAADLMSARSLNFKPSM